MGSFFDMFAPGASNYLTPDQQSDGSSMGLINAGLNLINASSNHYGLRPSLFQIGASGLQGYGSGIQGYANALPTNMNNYDTALQNNIQTQRMLNHFYPNNKAGGMAASMTPPNQQTPQTSSNGTPFPTPQGPMGGSQIPAVNASALQPPSVSMNPDGTPNLSSFYQSAAPASSPTPSVASPATPSGGMTSFGMDVPTLARQMYQNGSDMSYTKGGEAAGADMMKQAIAMDPTILQSNAAATAQGQLPSELTKIAATGNQARQTETQKAAQTPAQQTMMINGSMATVPTNNLALATNQAPSALASFYGQPSASGQPNSVSPIVPSSAKSQSDKMGENMAEAQKAQSMLDSRMSNALSMIQQMKELAPNTFSGYTGEAGNAISRETGTNNARHSAQEKFEQLNSNLFTQELPGIIQGSGGRIDIPLLQAIKQASAIEPFEDQKTKSAMLDNLQGILLKAQKNAGNNVQNLSAQSGLQAQQDPTGQIPAFTSPSDPAFAKLPSGSQFLDSSGVLRTKH